MHLYRLEGRAQIVGVGSARPVLVPRRLGEREDRDVVAGVRAAHRLVVQQPQIRTQVADGRMQGVANVTLEGVAAIRPHLDVVDAEDVDVGQRADFLGTQQAILRRAGVSRRRGLRSRRGDEQELPFPIPAIRLEQLSLRTSRRLAVRRREHHHLTQLHRLPLGWHGHKDRERERERTCSDAFHEVCLDLIRPRVAVSGAGRPGCSIVEGPAEDQLKLASFKNSKVQAFRGSGVIGSGSTVQG